MYTLYKKEEEKKKNDSFLLKYLICESKLPN